MPRSLFVVVASLVVPAFVFACSSAVMAPPGTAIDGGANARDASAELEAGALPEASPDTGAKTPSVRCTQAELDAKPGPTGGDLTTAAAVEITFPQGPGPDQYTQHCIKVRLGTRVTFTGAFQNHPLEPNGGDVPSPIPARTQAGTSLSVVLATPGTFGFECSFHPAVMFGAIQVEQ
jgi:plastocyanin